MEPRHSLLAVLSLVVVSGCATRADLERIRRDQKEMRALLADLQVAADSLKRRVDSVEERHGEARGPAPTKVEQRLTAIEMRLAAVEARGMTIPTDVAGPTGEVPVRGTPAATIAFREETGLLQDPTVNETYRSGLEMFRQGQFESAISKLRQFIQTNPKADLADNAQYWIGESYYNQRDYNRAIIELNEVLLKYPQAERVPGALLALATAFADSGDKIDARLILQKLISDHGQSEEADIGRQKLQQLTD
jgi:tol-pal system protein YbgF